MYEIHILNKGDYAFDIKEREGQFTADPKGNGPSPSGTLLASLGACIGVYVRRYFKGTNLELGEFSVKVEADFSKEKPISFKEINVFINLKEKFMDLDTILGIILITGAVGLITYLTFWTRSTIDRIAKKNLGSVREILKDLHDG